MAVTGSGFDGTLTEADWARIASSGYGMPGPYPPGQRTGELAVTLSTTSLEAYVAATGTAIQGGGYVAHGINIRSTASETVTFTNPSSGSRYDAVCALLDWTVNAVTFVVVQGTTAADIPWASMEDTPGYKVHVPLALVKLTAGSAAPTWITDWRVGAGWKVTGTGFLTSPGSGLSVLSSSWATRTRGGTVTVMLHVDITSALSAGDMIQKVSIKDPFCNGAPGQAAGMHSSGGFLGHAQFMVDPRDSTGLSDVTIRAVTDIPASTSLRCTLSFPAVGAV